MCEYCNTKYEIKYCTNHYECKYTQYDYKYTRFNTMVNLIKVDVPANYCPMCGRKLRKE